MREILFRGKTIGTDNWVYGDLIHRKICGDESYFIRVFDNGFEINEEFKVIPVTVGQYTGLKNVAGTKIFEGDIGWDSQNECYGVVKFEEGNFSYIWGGICADLFDAATDIDIDFVGNICDNPEFLEELK